MQIKSSVSAAVAAALSFTFVTEALAGEPLEHITVTANKFEQRIENTLATVNLIERSDIDAANARDLPELLQLVAGVDLVRSGGFGQASSVFVRGSLSKHLLVLVDGVRISDANSGDAPFSLLPLNAIERVEIVKGPRAAIYGSDALGGVINLITRQADGHELAVMSGSNNYSNLEGVFSTSVSAARLQLNVGVENTDGYDVTEKDPSQPRGKDHDRDGYSNRNIGAGARVDLERFGELTAKGQYAEGDADYDNAWGNDAFEFENYQAMLGWQKSDERIGYDVQLSRSQDDNTQTGTEFETRYQTKRNALDARVQYQQSDALALSGGVNWLNEDVSGSSVSLEKAKRHDLALFAGAFYDNGRWLANATVRSDDYQYQGRQNTYQAAVGFRPLKAVTVRLNQGTAFRAPTFTDLYVEGNPWVAANPLLQPEEARNTELGVHIQTRNGSWDVAIFSNRIDNLIASDFDAQSGKFKSVNIDAATLEGMELSSRFTAFGLEHTLALTLLDASDDTTGADLVRRPSRSLNWSLAKSWDKLDLGVDFIYRSNRPSISYFNTRLGGYAIINLSANYHLVEGLTLSARVDNLSDKHYTTAGFDLASDGSLLGYVPPGRQVFVGARYRF